MDVFEKRKLDILSKLDKSNIGKWDKKIVKLCNEINKSDDYYTTSSCSGRVAIIVDKDKKTKNLFIRVYHNIITFDKLKKDLENISENNLLKFKQEPCILHVACRTLEKAENLIKKSQLAGFKKAGIISFGKRFVVEISSTEKLEFFIMNKREILVNDDFLRLIVDKSNNNLKKSWDKINKLYSLLK